MGLIDVQNNNKLVTICYCIDTMRLLGDWQNWSNYQQEEDHFRNLETEEPSTMLNKIMNYATEAHLDYRLSYEEEA